MTTYDERERAFEAAFVHDQEMRFRVLARRNKALARWVAERLGRTGEAAQAYIDDIVMFWLDHSSDEAMAEHVETDLRQGGATVSPAEIRAEMSRLLAEALQDEKLGRAHP
jgi:hypothetical protein